MAWGSERNGEMIRVATSSYPAGTQAIVPFDQEGPSVALSPPGLPS